MSRHHYSGGGKFFSAGVDVADHTEERMKEMVNTFNGSNAPEL
jgi:hypothetical protein